MGSDDRFRIASATGTPAPTEEEKRVSDVTGKALASQRELSGSFFIRITKQVLRRTLSSKYAWPNFHRYLHRHAYSFPSDKKWTTTKVNFTFTIHDHYLNLSWGKTNV